MIVRHKDFEFEMDFAQSSVIELVIENKSVFSRAVFNLYGTIIGESDKWIFSANNTVLSTEKTVFVICDYFTLEPSHSRTIMNSLFKRLCTNASDINHQEYSLGLVSNIERFGYELIEDVDFSFEMAPAEDFNIAAVIKSLGVKIHLSKSNIVDRILEYCDVLRELLGIQVVVLVNLPQFINTLEIERLCAEAVYHDIKLLLLNSTASECHQIKCVLVDDDLCEIEGD